MEQKKAVQAHAPDTIAATIASSDFSIARREKLLGMESSARKQLRTKWNTSEPLAKLSSVS
jgi:hypothetical protein